MHETAVAQSIIEMIQQRIEDGEIEGRVRKIFLQIGRLSSVAPDNLRFIFSVMSVDSVIEGSQLMIERIPIQCECRVCGLQFTLNEPRFFCAGCGASDLDVLRGRELIVDAVEVDR